MTPNTTRARVDTYVVVRPLLQTLYRELKDLAKKKPEATVNRTKINIVNRILTKCRDVLTEEPHLEFLDMLDTDTVPQASDAVLMLSQYVSAMASFENKYYHRDEVSFRDPYWHVEGEPSPYMLPPGVEGDDDEDEEDDDELNDEDD